ncbi:unnamed protein product [Urochloa humidicola]
MPPITIPSAVPNAAPWRKATPVAREPLLLEQGHGDGSCGDNDPRKEDNNGERSFPWLPAAGFAYLTLGHVQAVGLPRLYDATFADFPPTWPRDGLPVASRGDAAVPFSQAEKMGALQLYAPSS